MADVPRQVQLGSRGRDIVAYKRALRKLGLLPKGERSSPVFDKEMDAAVRKFQGDNGLEVDGQIGPNTFAKLAPTVDAYGASLFEKVRVQMKEPTGKRQQIVHAAYIGYKNRDRIHYTQSNERMQGVTKNIRPPKFPTQEDCSSFVTWCYFVAGAPDPNGNGYNGTGYTGDQIGQGKETQEPRPGDLVFYGRSHGDINHVTLFVGNGQVISHGQETGPMLYPIDYSRGAYGGRQQIRSYL
jgi:peptidoglycan hydrolase-like protein with peptidoglycan-binding domain